MIARGTLVVVWLACFLALLSPQTSAVFVGARTIFFFLVVAHVIEMILFRARIQAAPGAAIAHWLQVFFFGMFHINGLPEPPTRSGNSTGASDSSSS